MASKQDKHQEADKKPGLEREELKDRILGTLYGNCIGDAIGLLSEFMTKKEAKECYGKECSKNQLEYKHKEAASQHGHFHQTRWKNGQWTDDSDQMILILLSILQCQGKVDPKNYGQKLLDWTREGFREIGKPPMGIGRTTWHVLNHSKFQDDPHQAAEAVWERSGRVVAPNGGVMRTSILGVYQFNDIDQVIANTLAFCKVTHADPRCQASCLAVTSAIALMLQGRHYDPQGIPQTNEITEASCTIAAKTLGFNHEQVEELRKHMFMENIEDLYLEEKDKMGYTYKCLGAGFWAFRQTGDFRTTLSKIVLEAGDADTNGAVAGALLGCKLGYTNLPTTWKDLLADKKWLQRHIDEFLSSFIFIKPKIVETYV